MKQLKLLGMVFLAGGLLAGCAGENEADVEGASILSLLGTPARANANMNGLAPTGPSTCAANVLSQMNSLANVNSIMRKPRTVSGAFSGSFPNDDPFSYLSSVKGSSCHVQGFTILPGSSKMIFSYNRAATYDANPVDFFSSWQWKANCYDVGPGVPTVNQSMPQLVSGNISTLLFNHRVPVGPGGAAYHHVGGIGSVENYVVAGVDKGTKPGKVVIFDASGASMVPIHTLTLSNAEPSAVSINRLASGKYIVVAHSWEFGTWMWRSTTDNMLTTGWEYPVNIYQISRSSGLNYNNLSVIKECTTNKMFIVGLSNEGGFTAGYGTDSDDTAFDVHEITSNLDAGFPTATRRISKLELKNPCGWFDTCPNGSGGATVYNRLGRLVVYATEHYAEGGDLDILEWNAPLPGGGGGGGSGGCETCF